MYDRYNLIDARARARARGWMNRYGAYIHTGRQIGNFLYNYGVPALVGRRLYNTYAKGKAINTTKYKAANVGGNYPSTGKLYRKRNRRRKYKKKGRKFNKGQKNYIKKLISSNNDQESVCTWRDITSGQISCEANQCNYADITLLSRYEIEQAISTAKVLDPNGGNLTEVTADLTSVDGLKTKILNAKKIITFRNNGMTPCDLKVYWLSYKKRTSTGLSDLYEDGLENTGITVNEKNDIRFDVYDSPTFNEYVRIFKTRKYRLNGGDEIELTLDRKRPVMYDPDEYDKHVASEFVPRTTLGMFFRMVGTISHDDSAINNVGTCDSTLDFVIKNHIKFSATGGVKLKNLLTGSGTLDPQIVNPKVVVPHVQEVEETL